MLPVPQMRLQPVLILSSGFDIKLINPPSGVLVPAQAVSQQRDVLHDAGVGAGPASGVVLVQVSQNIHAVVPQVGWFLHTPFPSSEIYRTLPVREEVLRAVLRADLIGFHTYDYARHFVSAGTRILGLEVPQCFKLPDARGHIARQCRICVPACIVPCGFCGRERCRA